MTEETRAYIQAWMADWCPGPEQRAIIIGVSGTLVYVIDAFANSMFPLYLPLIGFLVKHYADNSLHLPGQTSTAL
jgi:hypothetical protein